MADLDVEKKKNNDWWKWLLGLLALAVILWLIFSNTGDDDVEQTEDNYRTEEIDTTANLDQELKNSGDALTYHVEF